MKESQIKTLAESIIKYNGLSRNNFNWILNNFKIYEIKKLLNFLKFKFRYNNVIINFEGNISDKNRKMLINLFKPGERIIFKRNKKIIGGILLEYKDFIFDYTVYGKFNIILNSLM
ncbi:MAG: hypothetical protein LBL53_01225 [Endomicrobium sp.]|jgi:F0F1-type ATP synthase delta subunit|nr:hypothetical protein [Endomicrobium sp.]